VHNWAHTEGATGAVRWRARPTGHGAAREAGRRRKELQWRVGHWRRGYAAASGTFGAEAAARWASEREARLALGGTAVEQPWALSCTGKFTKVITVI
jgi:hypothetical protein